MEDKEDSRRRYRISETIKLNEQEISNIRLIAAKL